MEIWVVQIFFIFIGLLLITGGIRIIKNKKYLFVHRYYFSRPWKPPELVTGKKAKHNGIGYIVTGVIFILMALMLWFI